jgi:hypothetical protein
VWKRESVCVPPAQTLSCFWTSSSPKNLSKAGGCGKIIVAVYLWRQAKYHPFPAPARVLPGGRPQRGGAGAGAQSGGGAEQVTVQQLGKLGNRRGTEEFRRLEAPSLLLALGRRRRRRRPQRRRNTESGVFWCLVYALCVTCVVSMISNVGIDRVSDVCMWIVYGICFASEMCSNVR